MNNLLIQLQRLFDTHDKWNYYNLSNIQSPFYAPEYCHSKQFIQKFLEYSNKTEDIYDILEQIEPYRNLHIVVDYFLGILIYENNNKIRNSIDKQIKKFIPPENSSFDNSFKYFWFLICFYHDVGYYYENNRDSIESLEVLESELKIHNGLPLLIGVPKLFKNIKNKYLLYRFEQFNCYDHGIVGGLLLYDRLIKIYKYKKNIFGNGQNSFINNNLYWSDSMFKYFQLISSVILVHNIWFKNESNNSVKDIMLYKNYGLKNLIISDSGPKITIEKHPLLFLLSLVDSIEPTKRILTSTNSQKQYGINFLKKIRLIFSENNNIIIAQNICNDSEIDAWYDSIASLDNWLKIESKNIIDSHIEIILN